MRINILTYREIDMNITADEISALKLQDANDETIKLLLEISENNPDDLLRGLARVWLQMHAITLLKKFY